MKNEYFIGKTEIEEGFLPIHAVVTPVINEQSEINSDGYLLNYQFRVHFYDFDVNERTTPLIEYDVTIDGDGIYPNFDHAGFGLSMPSIDMPLLTEAIKKINGDCYDLEYRDFRYVGMKAMELAITAQRTITQMIQGSWGDVMTDKQWIEREEFKPESGDDVIYLAPACYNH